MSKIIAIGGGEIGRPGYPIETTAIDKEIICLSGKKNPKLLFLPTASNDSADYYDTIVKHFKQRLGCETSVLYLLKNAYTRKQLEKIILNVDIVYVGGGNTLKMMTAWRRLGVDKILHKAWKQGIVMAGLSAGSVCWFKYGNSDSRKFKNKDADLIKVRGLDFINALHCPHYDTESDRKNSMKKMMKKTKGVAIALDNCCALEVVDDQYRIVSSRKNANAYKTYWKDNLYFEELIKKEKKFRDLGILLKI